MNDQDFSSELNPSRQPVGQQQGYKNVLYQNEVHAFPINTADQDISSYFEKQSQLPQPPKPVEDVNPDPYNAIVKPALDEAKLTGDSSVVYAANKRSNTMDPFLNTMSGFMASKSLEAQGAAELNPAGKLAGNLTMQMGGILATMGVGNILGMEGVAAKIGLMARGATPLAIRQAVVASGDILTQQTVGAAIQGTVKAVSSNAMLGVLYEGLSEGARQGKAAIDGESTPDLVEFGKKTLSGLAWGPWGVGAPFESKAIAGLMSGTAAVFSTAYMLSRAGGSDEPDAVLNGIIGAGMHFMGGINRPEEIKSVLNSTRNAIADYVGAKNQASTVNNTHEAFADQMIREVSQGAINTSNESFLDRNPEQKGSWINDKFVPYEEESQVRGVGDIISGSKAEEYRQQRIDERAELRGNSDPRSPKMMDYMANYFSPYQIVRMDPGELLRLSKEPIEILEAYAKNNSELAAEEAMAGQKYEQDAEKARAQPRGPIDPVSEVSNSKILANAVLKTIADKVSDTGEKSVTREEINPKQEPQGKEPVVEDVNKDIKSRKQQTEKSSVKTEGKVGNQEPIPSEGKEKNSKLFKRIMVQSDRDNINNPTYNRINMEKETNKAIELQKNDPKLVERVAKGIESAPDGFSETGIRNAHYLSLEAAGKSKEAADSLISASLRGTRLGQEVSMYSTFGKNGEEYSKESFLKKAIQDRIKSAGGGDKVKALKEIDKQVQVLKDRLGKAKINDAELKKIIDENICK